MPENWDTMDKERRGRLEEIAQLKAHIAELTRMYSDSKQREIASGLVNKLEESMKRGNRLRAQLEAERAMRAEESMKRGNRLKTQLEAERAMRSDLEVWIAEYSRNGWGSEVRDAWREIKAKHLQNKSTP